MRCAACGLAAIWRCRGGCYFSSSGGVAGFAELVAAPFGRSQTCKQCSNGGEDAFFPPHIMTLEHVPPIVSYLTTSGHLCLVPSPDFRKRNFRLGKYAQSRLLGCIDALWFWGAVPIWFSGSSWRDWQSRANHAIPNLLTRCRSRRRAQRPLERRNGSFRRADWQ